MNVFLTGATGYVGSAVADALRSSGHAVVGLARSDEAAATLAERGVSAHRGDLRDPVSIGDGARQADAVVHTALADDSDLWDELDTSAVEACLRALEGGGKPFIYTSGVLVYGSTNGVVSEDSPRKPLSAVAWRPPLERQILQSAQRGIRAIVICPGFVYGRAGRLPERNSLPRSLFETVVAEGVVRYLGDGGYRRPFVHVADLADLYVLALDRAPGGTTFNATVGPAVSFRDMCREVARGRGRAESWPVAEARVELGDTAVDDTLIDQDISGARAMRELGWRPTRPSVLEDIAAYPGL